MEPKRERQRAAAVEKALLKGVEKGPVLHVVYAILHDLRFKGEGRSRLKRGWHNQRIGVLGLAGSKANLVRRSNQTAARAVQFCSHCKRKHLRHTFR